MNNVQNEDSDANSVFTISEYEDKLCDLASINTNYNIAKRIKHSSLIIDEMDDLELECNNMLRSLRNLEINTSKRISVSSLRKKKSGVDRMSSTSSVPTATHSETLPLPTRSVSFADMGPIEKSPVPTKWQLSLERVLGKSTKIERVRVPKSPEPSKVGFLQVKLQGQYLYSKKYCVLIDNVLYCLKSVNVILI